MLHVCRFPVTDTLAPTVEDQHGDAAVALAGIPVDATAGLGKFYASEPEPTSEELDHMAAEEEAHRRGLPVFQLSCLGHPLTFEAAADANGAIRKARRRGWARGGGPIAVEVVSVPATQKAA